MSKNFYNKKIFKFNLLPGKTETEIRLLIQRDNTTLYGFLLVFFAMFLFFFLNVLDTFFIQGRLNILEEDIALVENQINEFNELRSTRGEIAQKSILLESALEKDIKISRFIDISQQIVGNQGQILVYQREESGDFLISIQINSVDDAIEITNRAQTLDTIENVYVRSISENIALNSLEFDLTFRIIS